MAAICALAAALSACAPQSTPPVTDGRWLAESIDGQMPERRFTVVTKGGRVTGGYDGCNGWVFDGDDGSIVSDLQGCEPTSQLEAYGTSLQRPGTGTLREADGVLAVTGSGHRLVFRRIAATP